MPHSAALNHRRGAPDPLAVRFEPLTEARLDAVLAVEQGSYGHPWSRGNFADGLKAGHHMSCLLAGDRLVGYFVAMAGYREVHLLNLTVAPDFRRQGWARVLLDALVLWARARGAEAIWLEVRAGNARALEVYRSRGFVRVGRRKNYYPAARDRHEDAILMTLPLADAGRSAVATARRAARPPAQGASGSAA
jgi:ribosomal-protein-alanine N-acetyltransferase